MFLALPDFPGKLRYVIIAVNAQDVHKCRAPGKVLIVELAQNKPNWVLEQYQTFIPAKKICF